VEKYEGISKGGGRPRGGDGLIKHMPEQEEGPSYKWSGVGQEDMCPREADRG